MEKIVIYSKGKLFEKHYDQIRWEHIVAIVDKKAMPDEMFMGVPVILPSQLEQIDYKYIAIFSTTYFTQIKMELTGEHFVPFEKIISWRVLVSDNQIDNVQLAMQCMQIAQVKGINCVYDCGMRDSKEKWNGQLLQCEGQLAFREELKRCDAVLVWDRLNIIHDMCLCGVNYILVLTQADYNIGYNIMEIRKELEQYGEIDAYVTQEGIIWIADVRKNKRCGVAASIYVVAHKEYKVLSDRLYKPICVGGYKKEGYISEDQGANIAYLNEKINECTALYWIWKNTNSEYVGLNHYRRYFYNDSIINDGNYLKYGKIMELLEEYDIIFPTCAISEHTLLGQIKNSISEDAYSEGLVRIKNSIVKNQPGYVDAFNKVMNANRGYMCNLFVTKREILNSYCEWLFSFLIEAAETIDIAGFDSYSKRVIGFFAERMWTVWVSRQDIRIKELPYTGWSR